MVNKKGYIKTLEAVIAIIMIIVVSYTLIPRSVETPPEPPLIIQDAMKFMNQQIETDEYIREKFIPYEGSGSPPPTWNPGIGEKHPIEESVKSIVEEATPPLYDFGCAACSAPHLCVINTPIDRNVYTTDVFIASGGGEQKPKLVRVWLWEKMTETEKVSFIADNNASIYYNKCFDCIQSNKDGNPCTV